MGSEVQRFRVQGSEVQGSGFRVQSSGFREESRLLKVERRKSGGGVRK
jgi:hypothetical protein